MLSKTLMPVKNDIFGGLFATLLALIVKFWCDRTGEHVNRNLNFACCLD